MPEGDAERWNARWTGARIGDPAHVLVENRHLLPTSGRAVDLACGLVSFDLAGGREAGRQLVERVELAQLATSLGGPETLLTHPASTTHVGLLPKELEAAGIGEGTVRMSCGLEHPDDLEADLRQALDSIA